MKLKRVLTALIGFPFVVALLVLGNNYVFDAICSIIALISMNEYIKCTSKKVKVIRWISYLCAGCVGIVPLLPTEAFHLVFGIGIPVLLLILFMHVIATNMKITFEDISYTLIGILYIFGFMVFLPLIYSNTFGKNAEHQMLGKALIWFVLTTAWGTDMLAYFIGMRFGKNRFSKVSPKKSVEGCIGGIIGAILFTLLFTFGFNYFLGYEISYIVMTVIAIVLSIIGQIGDFSASVIKRHFEIKDFSELFPGHGGMLDRIDSVMYIAPFAYLLLTICL